MIDAPCPELRCIRERGKPLLINVADAQFRYRLGLCNDICIALLLLRSNPCFNIRDKQRKTV
jgi:hypothetical protein